MKAITWNSPPDKQSSKPFPKAVIVQSWLKISPHVAGRAIPVFSNTKYRRKGKERQLIEKVCCLSASGTSLSSYIRLLQVTFKTKAPLMTSSSVVSLSWIRPHQSFSFVLLFNQFWENFKTHYYFSKTHQSVFIFKAFKCHPWNILFENMNT